MYLKNFRIVVSALIEKQTYLPDHMGLGYSQGADTCHLSTCGNLIFSDGLGQIFSHSIHNSSIRLCCEIFVYFIWYKNTICKIKFLLASVLFK